MQMTNEVQVKLLEIMNSVEPHKLQRSYIYIMIYACIFRIIQYYVSIFSPLNIVQFPGDFLLHIWNEMMYYM